MDIQKEKIELLAAIQYYEDKLNKKLESFEELKAKVEGTSKINADEIYKTFPEMSILFNKSYFTRLAGNIYNYNKTKLTNAIYAQDKIKENIKNCKDKLEKVLELEAKHPNAILQFGKVFSRITPDNEKIYCNLHKVKSVSRYQANRYYFQFYWKSGNKHNYINFADLPLVDFSTNSKGHIDYKTITVFDYESVIPSSVVNKKQIQKKFERVICKDYLLNGIKLSPKSHNYDNLQGYVNLS